MVGKLDIGQGEDYAFDIRLARANAEGAGVGQVNPLEPGGVVGPYSSSNGASYWLSRGQNGQWFIWWDIDADPTPDVRKRLNRFLGDADAAQAYRDDVRARAEGLGY